MKTILTLFVLLFSSSLVAEDISDFEIENRNIGDSLLDYFSEEEIIAQIKEGKDDYYWTDQKFVDVYEYKKVKVYERVSASILRNDKNYIIYLIRGQLDYEDIDLCLKKQKEIVNDLESTFNNIKKRETKYKYPIDKTGKSMVYRIAFLFDSGDAVDVICLDIAQHMNEPSGLDVAVSSKKFDVWLNSF